MVKQLEKRLIPDEDAVFCYIHKANVNAKTGKPRSSAFQNTPREGDNLSCDWQQLTTAEATKARIGKQFRMGTTEFKNPDLFGVTQLMVKDLRFSLAQKVEHDPIFAEPEILGQPNNYAHSIIIGEKDEETRLKMADVFSEWVIMPVI
jgi:hypothetical protein